MAFTKENEALHFLTTRTLSAAHALLSAPQCFALPSPSYEELARRNHRRLLGLRSAASKPPLPRARDDARPLVCGGHVDAEGADVRSHHGDLGAPVWPPGT